MSVSWGQRTALGRRYSVDPALLYEMERLNKEYDLMRGREARGLQASQFDRSLAFNAEQAALNRDLEQEKMDQAGTSGMVGTVGNVLTGVGTMRALQTMKSGEPFFGGLLGGKTASAGTAGGTVGDFASVTSGASKAPFSLLTGAEAAPSAATGGAAMAATGAEALGPEAMFGLGGTYTGTAATEGAGLLSGMSAMAGPAAAGAAGGFLGTYAGEWIGERLGIGGKKERNILGGIAGGAASGAMVGGPIGAVIGGVIGGITGLVKGGTVICTELNRQGLISDELFALESRFGKTVPHEMMDGYRMWACPVVDAMRRSRVVTAIVKALAMPVINEMAHRVDSAHEGSFIGSLTLALGKPFCGWLGRQRMIVEVLHG